jgi:uncharacterized membrane protein YgdD (TMEM256/DUF423 family)
MNGVNAARDSNFARRTIAAGALLAMFAVIAGAFAAHGLAARLDPGRLDIFETAARYQMYHALALLIVGTIGCTDRFSKAWLAFSAWAFGAGILFFSGSLYLLALGGSKWLGPITPLGGLAFIVGWLALAVAVLRPAPRGSP